LAIKGEGDGKKKRNSPVPKGKGQGGDHGGADIGGKTVVKSRKKEKPVAQFLERVEGNEQRWEE